MFARANMVALWTGLVVLGLTGLTLFLMSSFNMAFITLFLEIGIRIMV